MNLRSRNFLVVVSLVLLLCVGGVGIAMASPDGDDDPGYNATGANGFGTQYSLVSQRYNLARDAHPVTTQDQSAGGAGSSVTATIVTLDSDTQTPYIELVRYDSNGQPVASFGDDVEEGTSIQPFPDGLDELDAADLLDIRVLSDGTIRLLVSAFSGGDARLWTIDYSSDGTVQNITRDSGAPDVPDCGGGNIIWLRQSKGNVPIMSYETYLNAARIASDGSVSALWTCYSSVSSPPDETTLRKRQIRGGFGSDDSSVYVSYYAPGSSTETAHRKVNTAGANSFGEDLELGPNDDPYVLTGTLGEDAGDRLVSEGPTQFSQVFHFGIEEGDVPVQTRGTKGGILASIVSRDPDDGSDPSALPALPVDLAVDHQGRPLVWTEDDESDDNSNWLVYRLTSSLGTDGGWGTGGKSTISEGRLSPAYSSSNGYYEYILYSLTVRPDDRVLVTGEGDEPQTGDLRADDRGTTETERPLEQQSTSTAIIAGLTSGGSTDTGFGDSATPGFKEFDYTATVEQYRGADFDAIGEPKVQGDGKVLVPHTSTVGFYLDAARKQKIAPPQNDPRGDRESFIGVSRLRLQNPVGTPGSNPSSATRPSSRPVRPSSTKVQCGRRVISLVRADVRGRKIRLTGLVGSKLYGKKVTIETNPTAVKASAYSKTATVTASKKTGAFTATVTAPKRSQFKTVRYRAKSGRATSPVLKLPQSLTSRSVKSAKGTITVKGQVKRSVLGKRNSVKIRRLVCGRYRTVAVVKPAADGSYTATFKASKIRGVSFYRAEIKVQVKPGSKKYAIQYARAIAIRTTSQTG